jgi:hypothetical protein
MTASATDLSANLGDAGGIQDWAFFSLGGGVTEPKPGHKGWDDRCQEQTDVSPLSGGASIEGNVGVAGSGNITLSGRSEMDGGLSFPTGGTLTQSGHSQILGK